MEKEDKIIKTKRAYIQLDDYDIIRVKILPEAEVTLDDVKEICSIGFALSNGKKSPVLIDIKRLKSIELESREYITGDKVINLFAACAILISSSIRKVILNFLLSDSPVSSIISVLFLGISKPPFPTKLFTSEEKAVEWLKRPL